MDRKGNVLRPLDEDAKRLARSLIRASRSAAMATILPDRSGPLASRVLVASDDAGDPIILVSGLARHADALAAHPGCSILFGEPNTGDPLASPRISVFGMSRDVGVDDRNRVRTRFLARHPAAEAYCDFADFRFVRILLTMASLNAGFARAYELARPDLIDDAHPELSERLGRAIDHMNGDHLDAIDAIAGARGGEAKTGWRIATADTKGLELANGDALIRAEFGQPIRTAEDIRPAFVTLAKAAQVSSPIA